MGIARPSSAKACVRSHQLIAQMCSEISEHWWVLVQQNAQASGSDWKRTERRHQDDAAVELMLVVRDLSPPVRQVVELRATGMKWNAIAAALPQRVLFSLQEDWNAALKLITERHGDLVSRVV